MVRSEWLPVFEKAGLRVVSYQPHVNDQSREEIRALPRINGRFAKYPLDELATVHSYFLLAPVESAA